MGTSAKGMQQMPEILVLGASGNVGGRLVRLLASRGERVRAASKNWMAVATKAVTSELTNGL